MVQIVRMMLIYCFFVSLSKHKRTGMNLLFVDTETNGIPPDQSASFKNIDNWPRIRQIAWIVYSKDGQFVSAHNYATATDVASQPIVSSYDNGTALLDFIKNFASVEVVPFVDKETGEDYSRLVCKDQFGTMTFVNMSSNIPELHKSNAEVAAFIQRNARDLEVVALGEKSTLALCKKVECSFSDSPNYQPITILPIHKILDIFLESLQRCDVIIGHNIAYDVKVILCELYRYGKDTKELESIQQFCTMTQSVVFCGFETSNGDRYPKLQELYSKLFHKPFENAHDAYCDIKATACCYGALFNREIINREEFPFLLSESMRSSIIDGYISKAKSIIDSWIEEQSSFLYVNEVLDNYEKALGLAQDSRDIQDKINNACFECAKELYSSNTVLGETFSTRLFEKSGKTDYKKKLDEEKAIADGEGDNTYFSELKLSD